jgi:hypothetical protein
MTRDGNKCSSTALFILALTLIVAAWTTMTSSHDSFTRLSLGSHPACLLLFIALPSLAQGVRPQLFTRTLCVWKAVVRMEGRCAYGKPGPGEERTEDYEKKKEGVRVRTCTEPEAANFLSCA